MKNLIRIIILGFLSVYVSACFRVGEDDPFFSMQTRKQRIVGTWELIEMERVVTYRSNINSTVNVNRWDFDGSQIVYTDNNGSEIQPYSFLISFAEDNSYEQVEIDNGDRYLVEGAWFWNGKSEALNLSWKEAIVLTGLEYKKDGEVDQYEGVGIPPDATLVLKELRQDKLVITIEWENTENNGYLYRIVSELILEKN